MDEVTRSMFEEMADNDKARFQREKAEYNMNPNGRFKHARLDILGSTDRAFQMTNLLSGQSGIPTLPNAHFVGLCTSLQRSVARCIFI